MNYFSPIKIKIVMYSYETLHLSKAMKTLNYLANTHQIIQNSNIKMPCKIKKYTLNRSPHIDKKSREQFKMMKCCHIVYWECSNIKNVITAIHTLKHSLVSQLSGVSLKIDFGYTTIL
jgi:ribosomal protein S10